MEIGQAGQVAIALVVVLLLIVGTGWLMRRLSVMGPGGSSRQLRVVASLAVGTRERLAVIEVGSRQILVGITPQQISTLLVLEEPLDQKGGDGDFARSLQALLRRSPEDVKGPTDDSA